MLINSSFCIYVNIQLYIYLSRLHSRPASSAADAGDTSFIHPFIHSFVLAPQSALEFSADLKVSLFTCGTIECKIIFVV